MNAFATPSPSSHVYSLADGGAAGVVHAATANAEVSTTDKVEKMEKKAEKAVSDSWITAKVKGVHSVDASGLRVEAVSS
jgi:hypothetical protein